MEQGPFLIVVLIFSVLFIVFATTRFKLHPFLALLFASFIMAFASGIAPQEIEGIIRQGFGGILGYIGIVIVLGTIIGVILEKSGAAISMADFVLRVIGPKRPVLAMTLVGYIVSIPVFCDSAYVILNSLKHALAKRTGQSAVAMSIALATGLYATHTLVPPTPGPIAAAGNLGLTDQLGTLILLGGIVAMIAALSGYFWARYIGSKLSCGEDEIDPDMDAEAMLAKYGKLPTARAAFAPLLAPIVLICLGSIANYPTHPLGEGTLYSVLSVLGQPVNALIIALFFALPLLPAFNKETLTGWVGEGITHSASIILVTGAGGAFGAVIKASLLGDYLGEMLSGLGLGVFLPFIIAAALKTAQGSSTVALVATSAMMVPLLSTLGLDSEMGKILTVLAIGGGAMTVSHANDSFFWVVTQFSRMEVATAYKAMTVATLVQGCVTMTTVYVMALFLL